MHCTNGIGMHAYLYEFFKWQYDVTWVLFLKFGTSYAVQFMVSFRIAAKNFMQSRCFYFYIFFVDSRRIHPFTTVIVFARILLWKWLWVCSFFCKNYPKLTNRRWVKKPTHLCWQTNVRKMFGVLFVFRSHHFNAFFHTFYARQTRPVQACMCCPTQILRRM